jgi:hypothetical protein
MAEIIFQPQVGFAATGMHRQMACEVTEWFSVPNKGDCS